MDPQVTQYLSINDNAALTTWLQQQDASLGDINDNDLAWIDRASIYKHYKKNLINYCTKTFRTDDSTQFITDDIRIRLPRRYNQAPKPLLDHALRIVQSRYLINKILRENR